MKKLSAVGLLAVIGVLAAVFVFKPPESSGDWAAWVQAFGAIAAIVGAVAIANHQAEQNRSQVDAIERGAAQQRINQLKAIRGLLDEWQNVLTGTAVTLMTSNGSTEAQVSYAGARIRPVQTAYEALRKIPFHEVPQIYLGTEGLNLVIQFEHVLANLERLAQLDPGSVEAEERAAECVDNITTFTSRSTKTLEDIGKLVERYDGTQSPRIHHFDL